LVLLSLLGLSAKSIAKTWHVEKDGTGDYQVIQNAVDAAATGDTIRVGAGLFSEKHMLSTPGWTAYVRVHVPQAELTIIGNGPELTSIGQEEPYELSQGNHKGLVSDRYLGNEVLRVRGVAFRNMQVGAFVGMGASSDFVNCTFEGNRRGADLNSNQSAVENCVFEGGSADAINLISYQQNELVVSRCTFSLPNPVVASRHMSLYARAVTVVNCTFESGGTGIACGVDSCIVANCQFAGQGDYGVGGYFGAARIENCDFSAQKVAIYQDSRLAVLSVNGCNFTGVSEATYKYWAFDGQGSFHNCNLAKGRRYIVSSYPPDESAGAGRLDVGPAARMDFTNNWWGTSDADSIQAWIYDSSDHTDPPYYYVQWSPCLTGAVSAQPKGFGSLKSMFR
jgi:hypothetical protein